MMKEETKRKISEKLKGRTVSEETKAKLRGRKMSEETRKKMSESAKNRRNGKPSKRYKKVENYEEIKGYVSTKYSSFHVNKEGKVMRIVVWEHDKYYCPITPSLTKDGYAQVGEAGIGAIGVHNLMVDAFLGGRKDGYVVHHKNRQRNDNRLSNLQYVTKEEHVAIHRAIREKEKLYG